MISCASQPIIKFADQSNSEGESKDCVSEFHPSKNDNYGGDSM
jgi:hypothetical protein